MNDGQTQPIGKLAGGGGGAGFLPRVVETFEIKVFHILSLIFHDHHPLTIIHVFTVTVAATKSHTSLNIKLPLESIYKHNSNLLTLTLLLV